MLKRIFRRPNPREIKIGVIASRTGPLSNYCESALKGLELGIAYATQDHGEVAGRQIHLIIEDDGGDAGKGEQIAKSLVKDTGVDILQGCTTSEVSVKIARSLREYPLELQRVCMIAVAATDVLTGEWFTPCLFRTAATTFQDSLAASRYAVEHLGKRFCFISPDTIWGHQSRNAWWRMVEHAGGEVVGDVLAPADETNFSSYLKEAASKKPDVIIPSWAGVLVKNLLIQIRDSGLLEKVKLAGNLVDHETIVDVGDALAGMVCAVKYYYAFPKNACNDWFVKRHQQRFQSSPDVISESGFTSGMALVEALKMTEGDTSLGSLSKALSGLKLQGPKGNYFFREQDHQLMQPMYLAEMYKPADISYCVPRLIQEASIGAVIPPVVEPRE